MIKQKAFTLIELMAVVAIIGILAAIAIPSYQESMRKSRRADAQGALLNFANGMERHFTESNTYCGVSQWGNDSCGDGGEFDSGGRPFATVYAPPAETDLNYEIIILNATPNTFTLQASPEGAQMGDGIIELDSTGIRRWDRNKNGVFEADENSWD